MVEQRKKIQSAVRKVVLLGDSGVGKTSLLNRARNNSFSKKSKRTQGATEHLHKVHIALANAELIF